MRWRTAVCVMVLCAACGSSVADVPQTISYQGLLKQADGSAVPDGNYDITFRLYDSPARRRSRSPSSAASSTRSWAV